MIFPLDVNKAVMNTRKIAGENKVHAVILVTVLGAGILFFALDYILGAIFNFGIGVTIVVWLLVVAIVSVFVFRFVLFDENLKRKEYEGGESDSFAKYMWLRKDIHNSVTAGKEKVMVYEYVNGSSMCVLEFRFGSNDNKKAASTSQLYEQLIKIASLQGLESRVIDSPEDFRSSKEFKAQIASINTIKDPKAARNVMLINNAIIDTSIRECNVDVIYFMMRTRSNHQRADLEVAIRRIFKLVRMNTGAFRSIHFLNPDELMEFYREFYTIAAIDLSMMRTIELADTVTDEFDTIVRLLQVKTASGKVFRSDNDILQLKERQVGIK